MSRNLGRLPSLAAVNTLVGRCWELGSGSRGRTSGHPQSSHVWRACEARQGTITLGRCHQNQETQMTGARPVGTRSISLLCRGVRCDKKRMHTGSRPSCALQPTILRGGGLLAVARWVSLGQVRSGLHKGFLPLSLSGTSAGEGTGQEIGGIRG